MARICVVPHQAEEISQQMDSLVHQVAAIVLRPDTEVGTKSPKPGIARAFDVAFSYFTLLNKAGMIERIIEAEKEGYDAAVIHCGLDSAVREARQVVDIPVIGPTESSLLLACLLGDKFGLVCINDPKAIPELEHIIRMHGLQQRAITNPVRPMTMPFTDLILKGEQANEEEMADILDKARGCVADGAEVVIITCTALAPLFTMKGIAKIPETEVPLLDSLAVALKTAETMIDLKVRLGLPSVSRAGMYAKPREKDLARVRARFGLKTE